MKKYFATALMLTLFTLALTRLIDYLLDADLFSGFTYEREALNSYEFTDFAFRYRPDRTRDHRVVLVNIGRSRAEIAEQIQSISRFNPRVIGLVSFFDCFSCTHNLSDTLLSQAIRSRRNVVLASELLSSDLTIPASAELDSLSLSDPIFSAYSKNGFSNLFATAVREKDVILARTCRDFVPFTAIRKRAVRSFAAEVVNQFDSSKLQKLVQRNNPIEFINFRGNSAGNSDSYFATYNVIDLTKIQNGGISKADIENKIVLIGFLGDSLNVQDTQGEKFYTPLNYFPIGRSSPDMYSTVIHANIISMILDEDYINVFSRNGEYAFAFFICLAHVIVLLIISDKTHLYFDLISLALVFVIAEVLSVLRLEMFSNFSYKADLNVTLGTLAIASIVVSLYNGLFKAMLARFK